jgi:hypothetical protein
MKSPSTLTRSQSLPSPGSASRKQLFPKRRSVKAATKARWGLQDYHACCKAKGCSTKKPKKVKESKATSMKELVKEFDDKYKHLFSK